MDCRVTLKKNESFLETLYNSLSSGSKVNLLFDDGGISRAEGFVKTIHTDIPDPYIELENEIKINLKTIIAVNGIFLPEYGEC
jgi:short-subunit dehydrogenase involved in D-alanine esterification of teichoic acids